MAVKNEVIGICPICDREMWRGPFIDKHHFLPKMCGGRKSEFVHKVCHRKIHSLFKEKELAKKYVDPNVLRLHPEIIKFVSWISKKEPDFYDRNVNHNNKR